MQEYIKEVLLDSKKTKEDRLCTTPQNWFLSDPFYKVENFNIIVFGSIHFSFETNRTMVCIKVQFQLLFVQIVLINILLKLAIKYTFSCQALKVINMHKIWYLFPLCWLMNILQST